MPRVSSRYLELIYEFPLKPIRSDAELKRATKVIDQLADRGESNLTPDETAYLSVISDLIEKYEGAHYPIDEATPAQVLAFCIEQRAVTQRQVAEQTGIPVSTISELISEKRTFTMNHVERLSGYFQVSPAVFIVTKKPVPAIA